MTYNIVLYRDSIGCYWGECKSLGVYFMGHNIRETLVNARITIEIETKTTKFEINYEVKDHD